MEKDRNIIQVEFFNINMKAKSLEDVLHECVERLNEQASTIEERKLSTTGIKTSIRVYDNKENSITTLVEKAYTLDTNNDTLLEQYSVTHSLIRRFFLNWKYSSQKSKIRNLRETLHTTCVRHIEHAVMAHGAVGVEQSDWSYRPLEDDERHELIESMNRSTRSMVFVFKPNDLFSEKNKLVTHLI